MTVLALAVSVLSSSLFIVDASSEATYSVAVPRAVLRAYVDDIDLLSRNMRGVVSIMPLGNNRYRYQTEKAIPLSGPLRTEFIIRKIVHGDSLTVYRSESIHDENYMSCKVRLVPDGESHTKITISLRVRLSRENPSEVHWLAPVLGEDFISDRMRSDLEGMLKEFVGRSTEELNHGVAIPAAAKK